MANILVIDDSQSALQLISVILTESGHQVTACLSASKAVKFAARTPVDLIVTDLYMPEMDGLEFLSKARRMLPSTPVIAVSSAGADTGLLNTAKLLGAACTLQKPFSKQQLLEAVEGVFNRFVGPKQKGTQ